MEPISAATAEHYVWGGVCDGWHLVRTPELSVIEERMPAGASEQRHRHSHSRQFFFVTNGELTMELCNEAKTLTAGMGLEIPPGVVHQALNRSEVDVHFLVVSQPPSHGDRIPA